MIMRQSWASIVEATKIQYFNPGTAAGGGVFAAAGYSGVYGTIAAIAGLHGAAAVKAAMAVLGGAHLRRDGLRCDNAKFCRNWYWRADWRLDIHICGSKTYKKATNVYDAIIESERAILDTVSVIDKINSASN